MDNTRPAPRAHACPSCGLFLRVPPLMRRRSARCPRCGDVLARHRARPRERALAFALTGLMLFAIAALAPFLQFDLGGRERATTLITGPVELGESGLWALGAVVVATTIAAPLLKLAATAWVLIGLGLKRPPRHLPALFRLAGWLAPWAMVEVFLLGAFVAYTKLADLAQVHVGIAVYAMGGLMLAMAAADAALDPDEVWRALERKGLTAAPMPPPPAVPRLACTCCGLASDGSTRRCPRCGSRLHRRHPHSLQRSWALLLAAAVLYIPANTLPVMSVVHFGHGEADTIFSGVLALGRAGMWPLAALVFFASITVPVLKLVSLGALLASTRHGARSWLRQRTALYRLTEQIGRWSMIDVFMISILTALVRMGAVASVHPGPGALAFCAVVILTMLAASAFDPRLMWDAARRQ